MRLDDATASKTQRLCPGAKREALDQILGSRSAHKTLAPELQMSLNYGFRRIIDCLHTDPDLHEANGGMDSVDENLFTKHV